MRQIFLDNSEPDNHLYKLSFYSASEGYVGFDDWVGYTLDSGRTFTRKYITLYNVDYGFYSVNLTFGFGLSGVKAFDKNTLIAYGDYGLIPAILYSSNGGNTWKLVYHSRLDPWSFPGPITDMVFPENNTIGFAVEGDRVIKTTDGGLSWPVISTQLGSYFTNIQAINNLILFAFSTEYKSNKLLKSINGGINWYPLTIPAGKITSAYFLTKDIGWMTTYGQNNDEYVYKTANGGSFWSLQNDPVITPFSCFKMKFFNDKLGYALAGPQNTVCKTTDGGKIWEPLPRDNNFVYLGYSHNDLHFWDSTQFWAGGGHGFLEITNNGGGNSMPKAFFKIDTAEVTPALKVKLINYSRTEYQYKWYVNNVFISNNYNTSYQHAINSIIDTVKLIASNGSQSDTMVKYQRFNPPLQPAMTSFYPSTGSTGTAVTITGSNLSSILDVSFGGTKAASLTIVSANKIIAIVGGGASGNITISNLFSTLIKPGFTYIPPPAANPPRINSFTPASGPVGTVVTINGSNFDPLPANNLVFFGSARAVVSSASATRLTCTVPTGASFIPPCVLNTITKLTGHAAKPFHVTFANGGASFTRTSFKHMLTVNYGPEGMSPGYVAGTDLDGDGKPELMVSSATGYGSLGIYRNTSTVENFSFAPIIRLDSVYGFGYAPFNTGDLDGDGKKEIVTNAGGGSLSAYLNTSTPGTISFQSGALLPQTNGSNEIYIEDIDLDGRNDVAVGGYNYGKIAVMRNTSSIGQLSFASKVELDGNGTSIRMAVGDLDDDGKKDIVGMIDKTNNLTFSFFKNTSAVGQISFASSVDVVLPDSRFQGRDIRLCDYDGDDKLDVIILTDRNYHIFRNTSMGGMISFSEPVTYPIDGRGQGGTVDNLNGDNKPDLLRGSWGDRYYWLYKNISLPGTISIEPPVKIEGPYPYNIVPYYTNTADFNLDGKTDMILSGSADKMVSVYRNIMGDDIITATCEGADLNLYAGVNGTNFQWQVDSGNGFSNVNDNGNYSGTQTAAMTISKTPLTWNNHRYRCRVDGNYSSVFLLQVAPSVNPKVTISTASTTVCGGSGITFTAQVANPGANSVYRWEKNGVSVGNNSNSYVTSTLNNNDRVRVIYSSYGGCSILTRDTSNVITMTVTGGIPSVSITATTTVICGDGTSTFTATPVYAGTAPSYQWQINGVNAGTNSTSFTPASLNNGDVVKVIMTAVGSCAVSPVNSNSISMVVKPKVTPAVSISAPSASICAGAALTFTAAPINGGSTPAYQWQINGVNTGTNTPFYTTSALTNNDQVQVVLTSDVGCVTGPSATSNTITISVTEAVTPTVNITTPSPTICAGANTTFTAVSVDGGTAPVYQWQVNDANAGTNSSTFSSNSLPDQAQVKVIMTSNSACATSTTAISNIITVTISPPAAPASLTISGNTTVPAGQASNITAAALNGGTAPLYQWQDSSETHSWQDVPFAERSTIDYIPPHTGAKLRCRFTSMAACIVEPTVFSNVLGFTVTTNRPANSTAPRIYPNPVTTTFTIDSLRLTDNWQSLEIASMDGKHKLLTMDIRNQTRGSVDVANLPAGLYLVILRSKTGETVYMRFMKG
ncbi:FG-GAP-like repeat-containing protein [Terrimonas pollutisoli]|uniref:FG-GAP-like repeat-containing protein n=1 Tax=Terrimonas pollutisoli TaxID=3034147 RepID=UPI0023ED2F96|nr:FG-GAP-like repeat-containing protein [Terrimonas sp. H1YJ31]